MMNFNATLCKLNNTTASIFKNQFGLWQGCLLEKDGKHWSFGDQEKTREQLVKFLLERISENPDIF